MVGRTVNYVIGAYELDRRFGGREEGGWWYDTGTLVRILKVVHSKEEAWSTASRYNHLLNLFFKQSKKRNMYSVVYRGGQFAAFVFENTAPAFFPEERPHYE
jgi:hypothetical protein